MHPFHIFISVWNLICGFALILLFAIDEHTKFTEWLAVISVAPGYFANLSAVFTSLVLCVFGLIHLVKGSAQVFIKTNWLGLFNGTFVILFWASFFWYSEHFPLSGEKQVQYEACYKKYQCNWSSWISSALGGTKACNQCNSAFLE